MVKGGVLRGNRDIHSLGAGEEEKYVCLKKSVQIEKEVEKVRS